MSKQTNQVSTEATGRLRSGQSASAPTLIRETRALDPETMRPCPARVVEKEGEVFLEKNLASGRRQDIKIETDSAFYKRFAHVGRSGRQRILNHFLYVTSRCNLKCPVCYESERAVEEPSLQSLKDILAGIPKCRVLLCGAEPTCRDDLPEIIRAAAAKSGVMLMSNGIRLADQSYLRRLRDAGLEGVILALNGVNDEVHQRINGAPLLRVKMQALDNLEKLGMTVFLSVTVARGVNEDQIGPLLDLEKERPCILQIRFRSMAELGAHLSGGQFFMSEFVKLICRESGIDYELWLNHQDFMERFGRRFGIDHLRPRLCAMKTDLDFNLVPLASQRGGEAWDALHWPKPRLLARLAREWGLKYGLHYALNPSRLLHYTPHNKFRRIALRVWPSLDTIDLDLNQRCTSLYYRASSIQPFCLANIRTAG